MELSTAQPAKDSLLKTKTGLTKYPFIDFIRFISMMGIVWAHTEAFPFNSDPFHFLKENGDAGYYIFFKQFFKFSVFCFFIISGFLLGDKVTHISPVEYLKRRANSTLRPYLISLLIFMIIVLYRKIHFGHESYDLVDILRETKYIIIGTPYWFIPTFFVSLITILIFIRYIDSYIFGGLLLLMTLMFTFPMEFIKHHVYGPNTIFFGYIFYIWLGIFVRRKNLIEKFKSINLLLITTIVIALFVLSSLESLWLFKKNELLFFNILRFSNQLYGLAVFIFLVRVCRTEPRFLFFNPRKETYGIYLYHFFFVAFVFPLIYSWLTLHTSLNFNSTFTVIGLSVLHFVLCYVVTALFVKILVKLKFPFM